MLEQYLKWIEAHERILLVAAAGVVLWFAIGKVDTLIANHDAATLKQAQVAAQIQTDKNKILAETAQQAAAQYQALAEKVAAQNAALEQANITLATTLAQRQRTDAALPPTELVARMNTLVPAAGATVVATGVTLPQSGAVAVTQELEKVPVLSSQLENERTQLENASHLLDASNVRVGALDAQVDGLQKKAVLDATVCKDTVASVKANARKSKSRWFIVGYVAGFLTRQYIKTATGF